MAQHDHRNPLPDSLGLAAERLDIHLSDPRHRDDEVEVPHAQKPERVPSLRAVDDAWSLREIQFGILLLHYLGEVPRFLEQVLIEVACYQQHVTDPERSEPLESAPVRDTPVHGTG